ncbi:MAG: HAD-IIA family hydrolase, partial [Propionibacteriaceae bacterium]|nr:HAD-IIA family hydrolase [Propionibacteriaceae bacterium]
MPIPTEPPAPSGPPAGVAPPAVAKAVAETFDAYLFDMDGTVYLGSGALPGAVELMRAIDQAGRRRAFVTNNPTRTRAEYAAKLAGLGIPATPEDVVTSATLTAAWILAHRPDAVCFPVGEAPLHEELSSRGIRLSEDPAEITLVISSYDRTFAYWKLQVAFDALRNRPECGFIATHPDFYCPFPGGRGEPDAAAITAAIEACTRRTCELVVGKPSPTMLTTALELLGGVAPERAVMVGDRLRTDIAMGIAAGARTALVLTGDTALGELGDWPPEAWPDYVLESVGDLA